MVFKYAKVPALLNLLLSKNSKSENTIAHSQADKSRSWSRTRVLFDF